MNLWTRLINNNTMRYGIPIKYINAYKKIGKIYIKQNYKVLNKNENVGYMIIDNSKKNFDVKHKGIVERVNNDLLCSVKEVNSPYFNVFEDILWLFDLNLRNEIT
jgi:glycine cleavage system H lipoate-binding protein